MLLIVFGGFYVAFAQSFGAGSYQEQSCTASTGVFTTGQIVYLLFQSPGPGEGEGEVVSGGSTSLVTMGSETSTCYSYGTPSTGTYTAYILELTGSATATQGAATFTVVPVYFVGVYADSGCSATATNVVTEGGTLYILYEMPGAGDGRDYLQVVNSSTTSVVAVYTGLSALSTCYEYVASNSASTNYYVGVHTAEIVVSVNTSPVVSVTEAFSEFTVTNGSVPDLPYGVLPILLAIALAYLLARRWGEKGEGQP